MLYGGSQSLPGTFSKKAWLAGRITGKKIKYKVIDTILMFELYARGKIKGNYLFSENQFGFKNFWAKYSNYLGPENYNSRL